nr:MAG TPA: hypothetical protein [Caudoviricetes sp.]
MIFGISRASTSGAFRTVAFCPASMRSVSGFFFRPAPGRAPPRFAPFLSGIFSPPFPV